MQITQKTLDELTHKIVGAAIEVNKQVGPGLIEKIYEECLKHELNLRGIKFKSQQLVEVKYKGLALPTELRYDLFVEDLVLVEIKSVKEILPIFEAQLRTYMSLLQSPKGIILNFNVRNMFYQGQQTVVNDLYSQLD